MNTEGTIFPYRISEIHKQNGEPFPLALAVESWGEPNMNPQDPRKELVISFEVDGGKIDMIFYKPDRISGEAVFVPQEFFAGRLVRMKYMYNGKERIEVYKNGKEVSAGSAVPNNGLMAPYDGSITIAKTGYPKLPALKLTFERGMVSRFQ